jgi:hypothetical protein
MIGALGHRRLRALVLRQRGLVLRGQGEARALQGGILEVEVMAQELVPWGMA